MKKNVHSWPAWALTAAVVALTGAALASGLTRGLELRVQDLAMRLIPDPVQDPRVVLLDVDDLAMQRAGTWPWSRNLHGLYLGELRSLGTAVMTFDVEFVDPGPVGVNARERDGVMDAKAAELAEVFAAYEHGFLGPQDLRMASETLLREGVLLTARDNDDFLGRAMQVFGRAFATLNYNLTNDNPVAYEAEDWLRQHFSLEPVTGDLSGLPAFKSLRGAIVPIASGAAGAGFTNVVKDVDGTLRRVDLLIRLQKEGQPEQVFGQLAFTPVWDYLGRPPIELQPGFLELKTQPPRRIRLDDEGKMVINWPHDIYARTFVHVSIGHIQDMMENRQILLDQVGAMQAAGYFEEDLERLGREAEAERLAALAAGDQAAFDAADQRALAWRTAVAEAASGSLEGQILAQLEAQAAPPEFLAEVKETFAALGAKVRAYLDQRASLESRLKGALAFYGWTAVSTTDIGVIPFDTRYYNVGTHAAVANTLLTQAYLDEWPPAWSFALGALLALGATGIITWRRTMAGVVWGFVTFAGFTLASLLTYALTGFYIGLFVPGLMVLLSALGQTILRFQATEAEKRYIRGAFSTYLSPDVIKQLEADPDRLKLGGEKRVLTAMFTDVKGFSTISEQLDPNDLVSLLNRYLTCMSDLILDTRGTIDKFEGDAIIAFWGAPLAFDDHAPRAVAAAIRMKQAEAALNEELLRDKLAPGPLLTRIGLNTGEMTVGNMGTARRMDYTMMGNAVNLAARLEGVNKEYGTWILTTQATRDRLDDSILVRKLDSVRVIGISTPVRLFEVVGFRAEADSALLDKLTLFDQGIEAYMAGDWNGSEEAMRQVLAKDPADGPAKSFLERIAYNRQAGISAGGDGVFQMRTK